jgi:hypothetical protein
MMFRTANLRRPAGGGAGLAATVLVHGAAIGLLAGFVERPEPTPPVYAVELVAAPALSLIHILTLPTNSLV